MDNYAIYLRKSRADMELEKTGEETLARHKAALFELARKQKLNIVSVYEEIISGDSIASRPQMQALLADVEQGKYTGVLVMEIERLARGNSIDQGIVSQTFKVSDTKIITPYKTYDPRSDIDEEYFEFGLFMARREYKTIKRRLLQGRTQCIKEGKYLANAPYGYQKKIITGQKGNTLEPVEEQADVVRMIFDWFVNGIEFNGEKRRLGAQGITKRLNQLCIPGIKTEHWFKSSVRSILTNPVYKGYVTWGRGKSDNSERIIVKGLHEPIVSEEIFDRAQQLIAQNPVSPAKIANSIQNPLAGLIKCAYCGRTLVRHEITNKQPVLRCSDKVCPNVSVKLELVEQRILDTLRIWVSEYSVSVSPSETVQPKADKEKLLSKALKAKEKELSKLQAQLNSAYDFLEQGIYSVEQFSGRSQNIAERIELAKREISLTNEELKNAQKEKETKTVFVPKVMKILEIYNDLSTPKEKNDLLKEIVSKAVYRKEVRGSRYCRNEDNFTLEVYPLLPGITDK